MVKRRDSLSDMKHGPFSPRCYRSWTWMSLLGESEDARESYVALSNFKKTLPELPGEIEHASWTLNHDLDGTTESSLASPWLSGDWSQPRRFCC